MEEYQFIHTFFKEKDADNTQVQDFLLSFTSLNELVKAWNEDFVRREMSEMSAFFDDIDGKALDNQQRKAIVVDEDANLIVAGAGSGKTLTISGKVKYLIEKKGVNPEDILLISFTRKAADEMQERIKERLELDVEVRTFHSIGMRIIGSHTKNMPDVEDNPDKIIKEYFDLKFYDDHEQLKRIIEFFGYYLNIPRDLGDFVNLGEYYDHHKHLNFETLKSRFEERKYIDENTELLKKNRTTIKGEKVKSLEEVMIANFLFLNGIEYIYEKEYQFTTANEKYRQYKPDFYLPEYDLYLEHFGINKNNRTPWLNEVEERKYLDGMQWKRNLHAANQTNLIETYSYYTKEGILLESLRYKLLNQGVKFKEIDIVNIFNKIYDTEKSNHFNEFIKFVTSFINLFKSNGYKVDKLDYFIRTLDKENTFFYNRTKLFLEIIRPIYQFYQDKLEQNNLIDFNDMINISRSIIESDEIKFTYKYIIIDEYQDISVSRFKLVEEIRRVTNAKVMCVGDDWQSIYRFAGSDLALFTDFENFFGYSELMKIEKTYRNSQELINIAGNFVMVNEKQIKKNLVSKKSNNKPVRILGHSGKDQIFNSLKYCIEQIFNKFGDNAEIMLLGRNNFDVDFIGKEEYKGQGFTLKKNHNKKTTTVIYKKYPKLKIFFLTVHRSKGLEADNVIIINATNDLIGFPNRMSDDPILSLVLTKQDELHFAEERRLFYVALTRTKNVTYILAPEYSKSIFVTELIERQGLEYEIINGNTSISNNPRCPRCVQGFLLIRANNSTKQEFLGCSNYPLCDYTLKDIRVINNQIECPSCKSYMILRKGPRGEFYGCSNYASGYCNKIIQINDIKQLIK
ncbi:UvrD-helicase domain-containing protein [Fictibacillus arsenicus]|uniref:DNA 3'-5' helicase n=1 Tax=Fictibacillus arsenicus TaxID=255247 RepID=A0A1V3GAY4_9BACL|nr:UvrD-helicase domain-containing protein [Fictibacillus arsenicus]OOE14023.1 hypothetical protein UN64_02080 [Fictibacillus arsenicus]